MLFCYELTRKILTGYDQVCADFCREQEIARTSFDILLFLANNPAYNTARDIVQVRHLKANLVSIHLDPPGGGGLPGENGRGRGPAKSGHCA